MIGAEWERSTADMYTAFAQWEARGKSPLYEQLCMGVAADREVPLRPARSVAGMAGQATGWVIPTWCICTVVLT